MAVLVTGAGGYTGGMLAAHLKSKGHVVRGMVRNQEAALKLSAQGIEPVIADLNDIDSLRNAVSQVAKIYHIAALFRQAGLPATEFSRVNVDGTKNLLDAAVVSGVENFIHCSTVGVHGHIENPPADEFSPYRPGDPYQSSKVEGEKLFLDYIARGKIKGSVIRPAMVYGQNDTRTLKLFKRISEGKFFYVGSGKSLVHFVDVRDLVEGFRLAGDRSDINGEVFILAGETPVRLNLLVAIISDILGVSEPWLHLPVIPMQLIGSLCEFVCTPLRINPPIFRRRVDFFTKDRSFNCDKARSILGYKPAQTLPEELYDIIQSYIQSGTIRDCRVSRPTAILRCISGEIQAWDEVAVETYGWKKECAIGKISHTLLSTEFPDNLEKINSDMLRSGLWRGKLEHRRSDGKVIRVESKWRLLDILGKSKPLVLELNRPVDREGPGSLFNFAGQMAGYGAMIGSAV